MVLYHDDGKVIKAHDVHLDAASHKVTQSMGYIDQRDIINNRDDLSAVSDRRVRIIIDEQRFRTLYTKEPEKGIMQQHDFHGSELPEYDHVQTDPLPELGVDRATLMKCSSLADEYFTFNPKESVLHLPIKYPRKHHPYITWSDFKKFYPAPHLAEGKTYYDRNDCYMAHIRREPVEAIIKWLGDMEGHFQKLAIRKKMDESSIPSVEIPTSLFEKIHLYNAMLQLGIPKFVQKNLIKEMCLQMYTSDLSKCELVALEGTIGRLYSHGVAVLDPVINHLIGTYAFRRIGDRKKPEPKDMHASDTRKRGLFLDYTSKNAHRQDYPQDRLIIPPRLPVIGHCIRNWSGVRKNGNTQAAYMGYPLNVGKSKKFWRRQSTDIFDSNDFEEHSTYLLKDEGAYINHGPGDSVVSDTVSPPSPRVPAFGGG